MPVDITKGSEPESVVGELKFKVLLLLVPIFATNFNICAFALETVPVVVPVTSIPALQSKLLGIVTVPSEAIENLDT